MTGSARTIYEDRVLRLADLLAQPNANIIEDATFVNCQINGPGVVFADRCEVNNCNFDAPSMDEVIWTLPPDEAKVGGFHAINCVFEKCRFSMVGLAVTPEDAEQIRAQAA